MRWDADARETDIEKRAHIWHPVHCVSGHGTDRANRNEIKSDILWLIISFSEHVIYGRATNRLTRQMVQH
jgi:hypothetical protein